MAGEKPDQETPMASESQYPLIIRAAWFLLIGLWASGPWIIASWLLIISMIGSPLGFWMINRLPIIVSLRKTRKTAVSTSEGHISFKGPGQRSLLLRIIYFVLIGWWLSLIWMLVAWAFSVTIIGLPISVWMYNRVPEVTTLYRHS